MSLQEKLQRHLGERPGLVWRFDVPGFASVATFADAEGARMVASIDDGPLAPGVIDAFTLARGTGASVTLAHAGPASDAAARAAARFGVTLLDLGAAPDATPPVAPPFLDAPLPEAPLVVLDGGLLLDAPGAPPLADDPAEHAALAFLAEFPRPDEPLPAAAPLAVPAPPVETPRPPAPPAPPVAAPPVPAFPEADAPLPWGRAPVDDAADAGVRVTDDELAAMPWHEPEVESNHEIVVSPRRSPTGGAHPTLRQPWGLPWPRPAPSADAVARMDPAIWGNPERLAAVHERLDRQGAPSFGAAMTDPRASAWLKKLQQFGGP